MVSVSEYIVTQQCIVRWYSTHQCDVTTLRVRHYGAYRYISFLDNQPRSIIGVYTSVGGYVRKVVS